jgi:hypothetical protein
VADALIIIDQLVGELLDIGRHNHSKRWLPEFNLLPGNGSVRQARRPWHAPALSRGRSSHHRGHTVAYCITCRLMLRSSPPSTSSPVRLTARPCADARRRSPRSSRNGGRAAAEVPRLRHRLRSGGRFHVLPLIYLCFCRSRTPTHRLPYEREPRERRWPARMRTSPPPAGGG